jgi:hypothetical protein
MNQLLLFQQFISNDKLDIDVFNLLSQKYSIHEVHDITLVQKLYPVLNGVSQSFSLAPVDSIINNYVLNQDNKKEKIGSNKFYLDTVGMVILKKFLLNVNQLNRETIKSEEITNHINEQLETLMPLCKNSSTHFNIIKNKKTIALNITEIGYLLNDKNIIDLGKQVGHIVADKNKELLLQSFIYHENTKGLQSFKDKDFIKHVFETKTIEQQFLFILNSIAPLDMSQMRDAKEKVTTHFEKMERIFSLFDLAPFDNPIIPISLYEQAIKYNPRYTASHIMPALQNVVNYNIDKFLDKHMLNKHYPDSILFKMTLNKEGLDFIREKKLYLSENVNDLLDKNFIKSENLYPDLVFEKLLQFVNIHEPKSFQSLLSINEENFKQLMNHINSKTPCIKDEQFAFVLKHINLDFNRICNINDISIAGVNKKMTLGNIAGVAFMNRGFINSFETLMSKDIELEAINGAQASIMDTIANRKKTGVIYATIVEQYKLSKLIESNETTIKKRVKI